MTKKAKSALAGVKASERAPGRGMGRPRKAPTRSVAARVPEVLAIAFHEEAKRLGRKRNDLIKAMLEDFVRRYGEQRYPEKQVA
jgi:hypothetical protein